MFVSTSLRCRTLTRSATQHRGPSEPAAANRARPDVVVFNVDRPSMSHSPVSSPRWSAARLFHLGFPDFDQTAAAVEDQVSIVISKRQFVSTLAGRRT